MKEIEKKSCIFLIVAAGLLTFTGIFTFLFVSICRLLREYKDNPEELDINCVDPLNRTALISGIENENIELIKLLIDEGIQVKVSQIDKIWQ